MARPSVSDPATLEYPDPELNDGLVRLRRWSMDDVGCIEQASKDPRIPQGTTVPAAYTLEAGRAFINRQWNRLVNGEGLSLAIANADSGEAVGLIVLMLRATPRIVEIGYWVVPAERGRGYVTRAIRLLSRWALTEAHIARVEARVMPDNGPSLRALHSCGFETEGILRSHYYVGGRHHDMVSLSLIPADLEGS
jgi:RimJ/RimL family protein N-acetyltransferase